MTSSAKERIVSYFYDEEIGNFCYGGGNPMRPHRARMVYSLLNGYGLSKGMKIHRPEPRSFDQLTEFHADDYIDFLKNVTPGNVEDHLNQLKRFNMGQIGDVDCPVFDGVYEYCQIYAGGSVNGATHLTNNIADVAFNWSGGMHHAKKAEASGFCYVNDIVLGILELLKVFPRVLYVDIDIHHGDGVEEAFYLTDRVMTVSFHKYGEFFPGTGALADVGYSKGKYYTVNVPLKDGMDDECYQLVFEPIMAKVMEMYQPNAIVMCCGADSLSGDKLGCFNLSIEGHSHCIEFLAKYQVPMLVLGGGGYTLRNVARCWTFETGRIMGVDLPDQLPETSLHEFDYYLDTGHLRIATSNMKNMNTREELMEIKNQVLQHLSQLPPVPSAHMTYQPAPNKPNELLEEDPDVRGGGQAHDEWRRTKPGHDSDDEGEQDPSAPRRTHNNTGQSPGPDGKVKSEGRQPTPPLPGSAMEAATLMTSEALQGTAGATNGRLSPQHAQQPPVISGASPMDVDSRSPGGGGAGSSQGGAAAPGASAGGAPPPRESSAGAGGVVLGASMQGGGGGGAGGFGGSMSSGGAGQGEGTNGMGPAISMLGPSSGLTSLSAPGGPPQAGIAAQAGGDAGGSAAGLRPNIIGASYDAGAPKPVSSPAHGSGGGASEGGGIYRPQ